MPVNGQLGNLSYVLCAVVGGALAIGGVGSLTLGKLASFLTFNKGFNQPITQISMQLNSVVMALAGGTRIFALLDEKSEVNEGDITLVQCQVPSRRHPDRGQRVHRHLGLEKAERRWHCHLHPAEGRHRL